MGKPQRRKRHHKNIKDLKKKFRTKRRTKDIDQVHDDMVPVKADALLHQTIDPDKPGEGQHYCLYCVRHFMDEKILIAHQKTKNHKKRMRVLKEKPYSHAEAELAAGMGSYNVAEIKKKIPVNTSFERKSTIEDITSPASTITNTANIMETLDIS